MSCIFMDGNSLTNRHVLGNLDILRGYISTGPFSFLQDYDSATSSSPRTYQNHTVQAPLLCTAAPFLLLRVGRSGGGRCERRDIKKRSSSGKLEEREKEEQNSCPACKLEPSSSSFSLSTHICPIFTSARKKKKKKLHPKTVFVLSRRRSR